MVIASSASLPELFDELMPILEEPSIKERLLDRSVIRKVRILHKEFVEQDGREKNCRQRAQSPRIGIDKGEWLHEVALVKTAFALAVRSYEHNQ